MAIPIPLVFQFSTSIADEDALIYAGATNGDSASAISAGVVDVPTLKELAATDELSRAFIAAIRSTDVGSLGEWLAALAAEAVSGIGNDYLADSWTVTLTAAKV